MVTLATLSAKRLIEVEVNIILYIYCIYIDREREMDGWMYGCMDGCRMI
jgi:hypothetical protein